VLFISYVRLPRTELQFWIAGWKDAYRMLSTDLLGRLVGEHVSAVQVC
jgi:hypothetical protein